jgi:hypothetical protein
VQAACSALLCDGWLPAAGSIAALLTAFDVENQNHSGQCERIAQHFLSNGIGMPVADGKASAKHKAFAIAFPIASDALTAPLALFWRVLCDTLREKNVRYPSSSRPLLSLQRPH